jgi:hypothetical protein
MPVNYTNHMFSYMKLYGIPVRRFTWLIDVSEEHTVSIFCVQILVGISTCQIKPRHNPEDHSPNSRLYETSNLTKQMSVLQRTFWRRTINYWPSNHCIIDCNTDGEWKWIGQLIQGITLTDLTFISYFITAFVSLGIKGFQFVVLFVTVNLLNQYSAICGSRFDSITG